MSLPTPSRYPPRDRNERRHRAERDRDRQQQAHAIRNGSPTRYSTKEDDPRHRQHDHQPHRHGKEPHVEQKKQRDRPENTDHHSDKDSRQPRATRRIGASLPVRVLPPQVHGLSAARLSAIHSARIPRRRRSTPAAISRDSHRRRRPEDGRCRPESTRATRRERAATASARQPDSRRGERTTERDQRSRSQHRRRRLQPTFSPYALADRLAATRSTTSSNGEPTSSKAPDARGLGQAAVHEVHVEAAHTLPLG